MRKRDVKPFISIETKNIIDKIAFLTGLSIKRICMDLCMHAVTNYAEEELVPYFKREIILNGKVYAAINKPQKFERKSGEIERVTMTFDESTHEYLHTLAYAIGTSIAKVVAYCIERSMSDTSFKTDYVAQSLLSRMCQNRVQLLKEILADINHDHLEDKHSMASLLMYIVDEIKEANQNFDMTVENVVSTWN